MTASTLDKPRLDPKTTKLTRSDRCDSGCPAQAHVLVFGLEGELMFCAHHYNKIMSSDSGREAMEAFAIETHKQDEAA